MTRPQRVLVSGWLGAANVGDELIFRSLVRKLTDRGIEVAAMSTSPDSTRRLHGVDSVRWTDIGGLLRAMNEADALILGPGGILQDETSVWNLPAHLHRVWLARAVRTPILGIGLGAGPLHTALGRRLVRSALRSTPLTVRDEDSARLLQTLGLRKVSITADLAYGLPFPQKAAIDRIVVSLRPFAGTGGLIPSRQSDLRSLVNEDRISAMAAALDELGRRSALPIHLLAFEEERDTRFHALIAERMSSSVTTGMATIDAAFDEVAQSRLVVGMRYHAIVSAVMASRPAIVIGYSPKARSLAHRLGETGLLVPNDPQEYSRIALGARLLGLDDRVAEIRSERRTAETRNDLALDDFLSDL